MLRGLRFRSRRYIVCSVGSDSGIGMLRGLRLCRRYVALAKTLEWEVHSIFKGLRL